MSYSFDTDGWDLFNTPFSSTPVRTAPAPSTHHAERSQQKPSEALLHNTPPVAQHNPQPSPKAAPPKATASASTQPVAQQKELVLDMSGSAAPTQDDTERRKAHEAAEAKRKAEWEARQAAKKQAEDAALQKLNDMSDEEALEASLKRISTETERLTRRNMKECVAAHIQELCRKDTEFARKTMHPRKSMVNCFKYITRMAKEYVKQEMEDMGIQQDGGGYGCDVPDGLCYQWGEDYFNAADAQEDKEKEETFIPKPYTGTTTKTAAKKSNKAEKKQQDKPSNGYEQISLEGMM